MFYRQRCREVLGALGEMTAMNIALEKRLAAALDASINKQPQQEGS